MNKHDKELVMEDLVFIQEYIITLMDRHPSIEIYDRDILEKLSRRIKDIGLRVEG